MRLFRTLLTAAATAALVVGAGLPVQAWAQDAATGAALRDKALTDKTGWSILESLTTDVGPRNVGSPGAIRARDWGIATFKALGFQNVHAEPFAKPSWIRGEETASITAPYEMKLSILGLGNSVSTPAGGVEAEIVLFTSLDDLQAAPESAVKGKIVVLNQPMTRTQDGQGYGAGAMARYLGPALAGKKGAVAYLTRSVSTSDSRQAHTGAMAYLGGAGTPKVPTGALGVPDADLLQRLVGRGKPVKLKLNLQSHVDEKAMAWNVVGEIPGSSKPEELIVIGGHLDAWDPGEGAIDDGAGVAITTAAAKLLGDLPTHPKRTIRVVMFGSEETGGSSEAYMAAHKDEVARTVLTGESDVGGDRIFAVRLPAGSAEVPAIKAAINVLAPLKIFVSRGEVGHAGSDVEGLQGAGVPAFGLTQDATRYFDLHHSADDTLDKVKPENLAQNIAAWASLLYFAADSDIDFRTLAATKTAAPTGH
jgi:Zn-dependent M28 family amino/carboxypeptidase